MIMMEWRQLERIIEVGEVNTMHKAIIGAIVFTITNIILESIFKIQEHQWYAIVSFILGMFIGKWFNDESR